MKIGLVPMSAKPYHAGHDMLVRIAASECDVVKLFVSISSRERRGEMPISGQAMEKIWHTYIANTLPPNVDIEYGGSPVGKVLALLIEEKQKNSPDVYVIYSDDVDVEANFPDSKMDKFQPLQIEKRGINRNQTVPISGTKMRQALEAGDIFAFSQFLPQSIQAYSKEIIEILTGKINQQESLLRTYIKNMLLS